MPLTFTEALEFAEAKRVVLPSEYYGQLQGTARDRAFTIAGVASRDQLQGVLNSLLDVQRKGFTFAEWKEQVRSGEIGLGLPDHRLDNIFRTNMQVAYNAGHWQQQQKHKDRRPYLMYDAVNDTRTRPSHVALDNVIRHIDDPFWSTYYPPNGYRCRCTTISMTEAQAHARGGVTAEPAEGWPKTDKGWDYNPGADPGRGVALSKQSSDGSSSLQQAMLAQTAKTVLPSAYNVASRADLDMLFEDVSPDLQETVEALKGIMEKQSWNKDLFKVPIRVVRASLPNGTSATYLAAERKITMSTSLADGELLGALTHELGHHIQRAISPVNSGMSARIAQEQTAIFKELGAKAGKPWADLMPDSPAGWRKLESLLAKHEVQTPSLYALYSRGEWLAEVIRYYILEPQRMELSFPKVYELLEKARMEGPSV